MQDAQTARACFGLLRQLANSDGIKESIVSASGFELVNQAVACHLTSAGAWASHGACFNRITLKHIPAWLHRLEVSSCKPGAGIHMPCASPYRAGRAAALHSDDRVDRTDAGLYPSATCLLR